MSTLSSMRRTIMHSISKKAHSRTPLLLIAVAIIACGLLIGCPIQASGGGGTPNLTITATLNPATVGTGGTAILTVTVTNSGTGASSTTTATFYRSTDTTIDTGDTVVGTPKALPRIAAQGTATVTFTIPTTQTGTAGRFSYGACIPGSGGTATCSNAVPLTVHAPHLTVTAMLNPTTIGTGSTAMLTVIVTNSGMAASNATTVTLYSSTDTTITTEDTVAVGARTIPSLVAGGRAEAGYFINPAAAGTLYYGACTAAATRGGTARCSAAATLTVDAAPYLSVAVAVTPTSVGRGGAATLTATVTNRGAAASNATEVTLYHSTDRTITTEDTVVGAAQPFPSLAARGIQTATFTIPASETDAIGTRYYGVCIPVAGSDTARCSAAATLTVIPALDLAVSDVKPTVTGTTPYTEGNMVTLSIVVTNSGDVANTNGTVNFYRQTGAMPNPTADGTPVATATIPAIPAGDTGNTATVTTPMFTLGAAGGAVQYYAVISGVTGETNTTNNTSMPSTAITISTR